MSQCLSERSVDHVVLERGSVAHSWKSQRWDSLRLLTPNWLSRLPGHEYEGDEPDGFMDMPEVIAFLERYAAVVSAPVFTETTVSSVRSVDDGYEVITDKGAWQCRSVVLASGACNTASIPALAEAVPTNIDTLTPLDYRNAEQLGDGGVLVVGASATGLQLADEIQRSGRDVTISVGNHVRMPRMYRGKDIQWWMDASGLLDERYDEVDDVARARKVPSPQLIGTPDRRMLDLTDGSVRTIVWATGFRPDYSWLDVDVLDHKNRVRHDGGVTTAPGMYLIGSTFLRRRKSSFIHGAGDDATDLAEHLVDYLAGNLASTP
jgi:putative flavoprotein involved in K+ transport